MVKRDLTVSTIRECLTYNPDTGAFTRAKRTAQCHQIGDRADMPAFGKLTGYLTIGLQGRKYLAHRVAWAHFYGEWPEQNIDHINGNKSDCLCCSKTHLSRWLHAIAGINQTSK